ncbi:DUF5618 family protein [Dyadobacter sp. CY343]|uniref:DUF5618 family protein n=1 Tax=Dyadobacter sp. CY343 TaxID=2907299 RepID=UPI001F21A631|nr:DUF5618 family protein [Dyadobacter sp. CY343]MCE7063545.1 DUF5618 family protein [Dyadobacter sp. CY343]
MLTKTHEERTAAEEAQRYLENASTILSEKAGKRDGQYADIKYVKMAAGTAYSAALLILDEYLKQKEGIHFKKPTSIEDYMSRLRKYDKKLLRLLASVYDELHLAGYYHGTRSVDTIQLGLTNVTKMLNYIANSFSQFRKPLNS